MTLNIVMALTLRYFNQFAKSAFQHITDSSSIELIDQKSASTQSGEVCVQNYMQWFQLYAYFLSFTDAFAVLMLGFRMRRKASTYGGICIVFLLYFFIAMRILSVRPSVC